MEKLYVNPLELKKMIEQGKMVGKGYYGTLFLYQNKLIKLDNILYSLLKDNEEKDCYEKVYYRYLGGRENFDNPEQIEFLASLQDKVHLTKLPQGIILFKDVDYQNNGVSPGTIIPYLEGYADLDTFNLHDKERLILLLKKLLEEVRELEENKISQEDLYHPFEHDYNIMYQGSNPMIVDMDGINIKCGKNYQNAKAMYIELGHVLIDFFDYYKLVSPYQRWYTDTFEKNQELVKELTLQMKGR